MTDGARPDPGQSSPSQIDLDSPQRVEEDGVERRQTPHQIAPCEEPIAIVDDDPSVCDSLTVMLDAYGFQTRSYASGMDFLATEHQRLGCLIIDQHMPSMDGLAVIAVLRAEGIATPAILITGRLDASIAARANRLGVVAILEKPFSVIRLVNLIRGAMDGSG